MALSVDLISKVPAYNTSTQSNTLNASVQSQDTSSKKIEQIKDSAQTFVDKIKDKIIEQRMQKIAQKPEQERTEAEQAEYEANQNTINYMV